MPWATLVGQISKAYGKQSAAAPMNLALTGVAALIWPVIRLAEEIDQREIVWFVHFSKPKCCARASGCDKADPGGSSWDEAGHD